MDVRDFYKLFRRNLILIILMTLLGVSASIAITLNQVPKYESQIKLFVSTQSSALDISALTQGSSFSQQRVKSYSQILQSPTTLEPVVKALKLPYSALQLAKNVKATAPLDTVLINVTVKDTSAPRSARIANKIGEVFIQYVEELESNNLAGVSPVKISLVENASIPKNPSSPKGLLNFALGLILGFGAGVGISLLRQIFDFSIKNISDISDLPMVGAIGFDKKSTKKPL